METAAQKNAKSNQVLSVMVSESLSQKQILSLSTENSGLQAVNTTTEAPEKSKHG